MDAHRRALIVATDSYEHEGLRRLRSPAADAAALASVLSDPEIGGFEVRVLSNAEAHIISEQIEDLFSDNHRDDVLLLHFSCHGLKSESGALFLAATNTRPNRLATAVAADFVQRCMRSSRSKSIVLFLDCCYGGAFGQGVTVRAAGDVNLSDSFPTSGLGGGRGRAVISASSAMEYAFEGEQLAEDSTSRPSPFTAALVEGLATGSADLDGDGWVSLDELYEFVFDKVREQNPNQTPTRDIEMQGHLLLAKAHRRPPGEQEAPEMPADSRPADTRPADTRPADTRPADTRRRRRPERETSRRRPPARWVVVAVAASLLVGVGVWWLAGRSPAHHPPPQYISTGMWPTSLTADGNRLYVVNCGAPSCAANDKGTVAEVDAVTHQITRSIPFGAAPPRTVAVGSGSSLYVATNGEAYRVDKNTYAATALNLGDPGVVVTVPASNRRYAYFAQVFTGVVTILDTETGNASRTAPAGTHQSAANPPVLWGLAARPDGGKLYVSSPLRQTVYVRKADGSADAQFAIPRQPWGLALSPDQNTLWIAVDSATAGGAKEVDALDLSTGHLDRVTLPGIAHGVFVPSSGHYAYVSSEASDAVYAVDMTASGHPYQTISLGRPGYGMAFAGNAGWTADGPANSVSVFALK